MLDLYSTNYKPMENFHSMLNDTFMYATGELVYDLQSTKSLAQNEICNSYIKQRGYNMHGKHIAVSLPKNYQ